MNKSAKRLSILSMSLALALILSFVESQIPPLSAVPGIKLGLANIVAVVLLYSLTAYEAAAVSLVRVFLSVMLFGTAVGLIYSLFGAVLSLAVMILAKRFLPFGTVGVSVLGAVMHNAGQIIAACIIMENAAISVYFVPLIISGTIAGVAVGVASGILIGRIKRIL